MMMTFHSTAKSVLRIAAALLLAARLASAAGATPIPAVHVQLGGATALAHVGSWSTGPANPEAAKLVPAGTRILGGFRAVRTGGPVQDPDQQAALPEVSVRADTRATAAFVVARVKLGGVPVRSGYWVQGAARVQDALEFKLPMTSLSPVQDVFLLELESPQREPEIRLIPDPDDPRPPGDRTVAILIHGYDSRHVVPALDPESELSFSYLKKRPGYAALSSKVKFYRLVYRPGPAYPQLAAAVASLLFRTFPPLVGPAKGRFVFVGHSAGGLVSRLVAADPRFWGRVAGIVTLATPHHGSVSSSFLQANALIGQRVGILNTLMLRYYQGKEPDTAGMRSLAFDGFDGTIDARAVALYGMPLNLWLRAFNAVDPSLGKIIAYQGVNKNLWGPTLYQITCELQRRALGKFHPTWASADPIVHLPSGTFAGKTLNAVRLFPGRSHIGLMFDSDVLDSVLADVAAFHRAALAEDLHAGPRRAPNGARALPPPLGPDGGS